MHVTLSELQLDDVWSHWLDAEALALYYGALCNHYSRLHRRITWAVLVASSGAVAAILSGLPDWLRLALAAVTAILSLWSLVENQTKTATDCSDAHFRWNRLAGEYKALWGDVYSNDAETLLTALRQKEDELSKTCNTLPYRPEDLRKWQRYVAHQHGPPPPPPKNPDSNEGAK